MELFEESEATLVFQLIDLFTCGKVEMTFISSIQSIIKYLLLLINYCKNALKQKLDQILTKITAPDDSDSTRIIVHESKITPNFSIQNDNSLKTSH